MQKIVDYCFVHVHDSADAFEKLVRAHVRDGWQPYGPTTVCIEAPHVVLSQAMVLYEEPKKEKK